MRRSLSFVFVFTAVVACGLLVPKVGQGQCWSMCPFCPPVVTAQATADPLTVCAGQPVHLRGSGGASCSWSPTNGLASPNACTTTAYPSQTTFYTVSVADFFRPNCFVSAGVVVTVSHSSAPTISAPATASPGRAGLIASVPLQEGSTYDWTIFNGTITSGQATNSIAFTAGAGPVLVGGIEVGVTLSLVETSEGCESETATAAVALKAGGGPAPTPTPARNPRVVPYR